MISGKKDDPRTESKVVELEGGGLVGLVLFTGASGY